jgi:hypothetical protein
MMTEKVLLGYVSILSLPRCHELAGNKSVEFNHDIYCNDQSYMNPSKKTSIPDRLKYIEIKHYILHDEV